MDAAATTDTRKVVFLAIPHRGEVAAGLINSSLQIGNKYKYHVSNAGGSILDLVFNSLWATAYNMRPRPDYFAMQHSDIIPKDSGWLDTLVDELENVGADFLHIVIPIKDERGLSSTAWMDREGIVTRLTMHEAANLRTTFDSFLADKPDQIMLPNSGLWVCRFDPSWIRKVYFHTTSKIVYSADDVATAMSFSEDWQFGLDLHKLGLKVWGTTKIKATHKGEVEFPNWKAWGEWQHDQHTMDYKGFLEGTIPVPRPHSIPEIARQTHNCFEKRKRSVITREMLLEQIEQLKRQRQDAVQAQQNAMKTQFCAEGAIQMAEYTLAQMDQQQQPQGNGIPAERMPVAT